MAASVPLSSPRRLARSKAPLDSPPRKIKLGSKPASRLTTPPLERSPFQEDVSVVSGMDIEELRSILSDRSAKSSHETIVAKSDELTVSFYANSPVEVKHILRNAGTQSVPRRIVLSNASRLLQRCLHR